jgi:hypothetical protein
VIWNKHLTLEGSHAFLSASNHHWVNYDDDKLAARYETVLAAQRGTEMHKLAHDLVRMGVRLPDTKDTFNMYVNDAIGYRMKTEQTLFYSFNAFGTADAISFRRSLLRIHDLKTGVTKTSMTQLKLYAAFFCLEYGVKPFDIEIELRIYQNGDVQIHKPDPDEITHLMDRIVTADRFIEELRREAQS